MFQPKPGFVFVCALEASLLRSILFLLVSEGYSVDSSAVWPPDRAIRASAVIVDESSLSRSVMDDPLLSAIGEKLIFLTNKPILARHIPTAKVLPKPLLDGALMAAVRDVAEGPRPQL